MAFMLVRKKLLLSAGLNESDLNSMSRDKWLVQNLADEGQQSELEQIAEQYDNIKADFDKKI